MTPTTPMALDEVLPPIERDEEFDRDYIPMPGGWEVQTKGKGSTFRLAGPVDDDRLPIPPSPYLHETLTKMARDVHAATAALQSAHAEVVAGLRTEVALARFSARTHFEQYELADKAREQAEARLAESDKAIDELTAALSESDNENAELEARLARVEADAARWRWVSERAWFVDAAAYAFDLRFGPRDFSTEPHNADADDVREAIDAVMQEEVVEAQTLAAAVAPVGVDHG